MDNPNNVHNTIIVVNILWKAAMLTTVPPIIVENVL